MKLKTIAISVATVLCSAGTIHAAVNDANANDIKLQAPKVTFEQIKQLTKEHNENNVAMLSAQQGINIQLNPQHNKFKSEGLDGEHIYIVRLNEDSVSVAARQIDSSLSRSLNSTGNTKLFSQGKATSRAVINYQKQLLNKQAQVLNEVTGLTGVSKVRHQFTKALNGFSITLTETQAEQISQLGSVASVMRSKRYDLLSDEGPHQIGADQLWSGNASPQGIAGKGEGQIIGIIDTGVNTDHPSFADIGGDGYDHTNPWGAGNYVGDCVEDADAITCNDKLIGVRSYDVITDTFSAMIPGWPAIGEDYQGHGSHTASTAAGNIVNNIPYMATGFAEESDGKVIKADLFPQISGVAPHANIISYQVCHADNDSGHGGCPGEALLAGIEDAISDGVDVINFSIGGADSNVWADPVQLAFLSAREAGISVAAAAGNSGTGDCGQECMGYIDNSSPWLAQVAATTHGRTVSIETAVEYAGFIDPTLGSEVPEWADIGLLGGAINAQDITGVVVWSKDYADVDGFKDSRGYCTAPFPEGTFDFYKDGTPIAGAAEGETNVIVICQRHDSIDVNANPRTDKVENVKAGGADAFIMYNYHRTQSTVPEAYSLPGVHFTYNQWNGVYPAEGLEDWVDSSSEKGHMITIKATEIERRVNPDDADWLADFSSRGPSFSNIDVMAPTLAAPGVDIYAAFADEHPFVAAPFGADYAALSGTSMASPHVAGSMALVRQVQPNWTPAEVQSALSMTADNVVQYHRLNVESGNVDKAQIYRTGAGRINVANAVKSGLVMDETAENFLAADPFNGGTPHKLNLPNLIDLSCAPQCQWVRTVKATRDGTWTVSHEDVINWSYDMNNQTAQNGVNIEILPNEFTLKAGETQTIIVKASIMDTQDFFSNSEVELHTNLLFNANNTDIPQAHWPMAFKYDGGELPARLSTTVNANDTTYVAKHIPLPATDAPVGRAYQPVKAQVKTVTIPKDDERIFPWALKRTEEVDPDDVIDSSVYSEFITVPAGSKRLVVEMLDVVESAATDTLSVGNPNIYIGKDYNQDGIIQPQDEILCVSSHATLANFCNINNPEPGEYWTLLYNPEDTQYDKLAEQFSFAIGVVSGDVADNISVSLPASNGKDTVDMNVHFNMDMSVDDIYYTLLEVGTSNVNQSNIGSIPFNFTRGNDLVSLDVPKSGAKISEQVPYTFEVLANNSGMDREFTITADIPKGLSITPENVLTSSQNDLDVSIVDDQLIIKGTQEDTSEVKPDYIVTDNITDQMCKLPDFGNSNPGGYVDLSELGISPSMSGFDEKNFTNYRDGWSIPYSLLFSGVYNEYSMYNNAEQMNVPVNYMNIRGNGMVSFNGGAFPSAYHLKQPFYATPFENVAPLWRAASTGYATEIMSVGLGYQEGITLASSSTGWALVEWDNASDYADPSFNKETGQYEWTKRDNSFDFELVFNMNTRFGKNEHEMYFAYDNIDFADTDERGSIGFQGFRGTLYGRGPLSGYLGQSIAYNNLEDVIKDDYIICMDYVGPESSQFEITAWADVTADAAGNTLEFNGVTSMSGTADMPFAHQLNVPSHITVVALEDMTTMEETPVSFTVQHIDEVNSANQILVAGEGISAVIDGDQVTVTPDENFSGVTEVTVTVADIEHPSDAATTSFMLTVENVSDAPTASVAQSQMIVTEGDVVTLDASSSMDVDGDELTFTWSGDGVIADNKAATTTVSGLTAGEHTFTVAVSDGEHTSQATVMVQVVTSESRLSIDAISNVNVDEDNNAEITVHYSNELGTDTVLSAMADNASVEVMGDESGSVLKVTPTANFNGDIEVTVMVAFKDDPSAVAQTTFTLTVNAVNDAPVAELAEQHIFVREDQVPTLSVSASDLDGDELSYEWTGSGVIATPNAASTQVSGLVPGEYAFTVMISDGTDTVEKNMQVSVTEAPEVEEPEDNDSSGSLAWLTLLMAGFAGARRRRANRD